MADHAYRLNNEADIASPALVYYEDIIRDNTRKVLDIAGGAGRMWPHVKTHKMPALVRMQMELGISRFKCATIAETEMVARCGAPDVLMSYPLVGPNIARFLRLVQLFPAVRLWALGDDLDQLRELGRQAARLGVKQRLLVDVDVGMHRTGVAADAVEEFYRRAAALPGLELRGLHCYDGHLNTPDFEARLAAVTRSFVPVYAAKAALEKDGLDCGLVVAGGTPTFRCHARTEGEFLSPGTIFVYDHGYQSGLPDVPCAPGAALFTRVISRTGPDLFTLDLGYKAIASDPAGARGVIVGLPEAEPVGQSEEHWVFRMKAGAGKPMPKVGDAFYVIPTHICPTSALYPAALVARGGEIAGTWEVAARNRKITV